MPPGIDSEFDLPRCSESESLPPSESSSAPASVATGAWPARECIRPAKLGPPVASALSAPSHRAVGRRADAHAGQRPAGVASPLSRPARADPVTRAAVTVPRRPAMGRPGGHVTHVWSRCLIAAASQSRESRAPAVRHDRVPCGLARGRRGRAGDAARRRRHAAARAPAQRGGGNSQRRLRAHRCGAASVGTQGALCGGRRQRRRRGPHSHVDNE